MTELEQKAKEYVAKKADSGNFDVEQFGKVYFSESSMEHALVDFATQITKELENEKIVFNQENSIPIIQLKLSSRTQNALIRNNIKTLQKLLNYSAFDLVKIHQLGKKSFKEIILCLHERNLCLKDEIFFYKSCNLEKENQGDYPPLFKG